MAKRKQTTKRTKQAEDTELLNMARYCPECDADVVPDKDGQIRVNFCPDCGIELWQPIRCIWCNNPINASAAYCTGCGMMIRK